MSDIDRMVRPGDVLAGKYRVERVLGAGGMGVVVAAQHLQLDERVAIKFLLPTALDRPEALSRFEREARAVVKIKSEHVARIIDVGRLESGAPYLVMEYLEGRDLAGLLVERGPFSFEQAIDFVVQACEAIAEAHALGIIHRDLKPANLFCLRAPDGLALVKVLDFGISKSTQGVAEGGMTRTAALLGSPFYMSPEQMQSSKTVDARTDIWSLGVVLYQLVTEQVPFKGDSLPDLVLNIANVPAPSLFVLRPDAPPLLERTIARCLEKDRERRYANVGELAVDLAPLAPARSRPSIERIVRIVRGTTSSPPRAELPFERATPPPTPLPPRNSSGTQRMGITTGGSWGKTTDGKGSSQTSARLAFAVSAVLAALVVLAGGAYGLTRLARSAAHLGVAPRGSGSPPASVAASVALAAAETESKPPESSIMPAPAREAMPEPPPSTAAHPVAAVSRHPNAADAPAIPSPAAPVVKTITPPAPIAQPTEPPPPKTEASRAPPPASGAQAQPLFDGRK